MGSSASATKQTNVNMSGDNTGNNKDQTENNTKSSRQTTGLNAISAVKSTLNRLSDSPSMDSKNTNNEEQKETARVRQKETVVIARVADHMPEHALIQCKYCLVRDVNCDDEQVSSQHGMNAPNFNRCKNNFPIFGMGQPTLNCLSNILKNHRDEGFKDILLVNLREDPVLFSKVDGDYIPYSLRHYTSLEECLVDSGRRPWETAEMEVNARREVMHFAKQTADNCFFFYDDSILFMDDPHMHHIRYQDELKVAEEVYVRAAFTYSGIRTIRLACPPDGFPIEEEVDDFVGILKELGGVFFGTAIDIPALNFNCRTGVGATQLFMIIGYLLMMHKMKSLTPEIRARPKGAGQEDPLENGEYQIIKDLIKFLPDGPKFKEEVDNAIDVCDNITNIRLDILEARRELDINLNDKSKDDSRVRCVLYNKFISKLERYFMLICFNAYLHSQYKQYFRITFSRWIRQKPGLYRFLPRLDMAEHYASPTLLQHKIRYMVQDDYTGLDMLYTKTATLVSNFRRLGEWPVYGCSYPNTEGLAAIHRHLTGDKYGHARVIFVNLRDDLTIECDGKTYSWRDKLDLETPVSLPNISADEIEAKEAELVAFVKTMENMAVVDNIKEPPKSVQFKEVLSCREMFDKIRQTTTTMHYHRLPMNNDGAPPEQCFDQAFQFMKRSIEIAKNDCGNALMFSCRTGKGRTTAAMAVAALVYCHLKGFPKETYVYEDGSDDNKTEFKKGEYMLIQKLVRMIPHGQKSKREIDYILDKCNESAMGLKFHIREDIYYTFHKLKTILSVDPDRQLHSTTSRYSDQELKNLFLEKKSLDFLERYFYLILFNAYLHAEKERKWETSFTDWLPEISTRISLFEIIDDLGFPEFETKFGQMKRIRYRWRLTMKPKLGFRGLFM